MATAGIKASCAVMEMVATISEEGLWTDATSAQSIGCDA